MIAGYGVTHSDRTSAEPRKGPGSLFGIQTWAALPDEKEQIHAAFEHHAEEALPMLAGEEKSPRLIRVSSQSAQHSGAPFNLDQGESPQNPGE